MVAKLKSSVQQSFRLGVNNRLPDTRLQTPEGYFLAGAPNVDVLLGGSLRRRRGFTLAVALSAGHSFYADEQAAYVCDGTSLQQVTATPAGVLTTAPVTTVAPGRTVSYAAAPEGGHYWTDGVRLERLVDGASVPLRPPPPALVPTISVTPSGVMPPGRYNVLVTAVDAAGRESAPSPLQQAVVPGPGTGGLQLSLGAPTSEELAVYVGSESEEPYYVGSFSSGTLSVARAGEGRRCPTYGLAQMPAGDLVATSYGRLFVAAGSTLFYSEMWAPGLYKAEMHYIPFKAPITLLEPISSPTPDAPGGIYVAADATYWLAGDPVSSALVQVLPYGAVRGSAARRRDVQTVCWMSTRGLVEGAAGGVVKPYQEASIAVVPTQRAASLVREHLGMKQLVSSFYGAPTAPTTQVRSYMDVEMSHGA
jgi:hypothetical protein